MTPADHSDEIVWLDGDGADHRPDEELPGGDRPPIRRRTRILLGAAAAVVLGAAVTVGLVTGSDERPSRTPTRTVEPPATSERTFALEPVTGLPQRAPRDGLAAIRAVFPRADLTSFVAATAPGTDGGLGLIYNARSGRRLITVTVRPMRPSDRDEVNRTATSVEIVQQLGRRTVGVLLRTERGAPSARDFAGLQTLVQDTRLLATS